MLTLLALVSAGSAPAGCFNGGALVGAQVGFSHIMLKKEAKAKPITKADATEAYNLVASALQTATNYEFFDASTPAELAAYTALKSGLTGTNYVATVDQRTADWTATTGQDTVAAAVLKAVPSVDKAATTVAIKVLVNNKATLAGGQAAAQATLVGRDAIAKLKTDAVRDAAVAALVAADAETKYTSNNGFAGIHAGYLGRVNDKFLVGGLIEGNWVFGKDIKQDGGSEIKDTSARFNANVFLRAMFNLTEKFLAGADLGFSGQEFRQFKTDAAGVVSKDKESKWFWNPAARVVLGLALTDNILATAHVGGVFPMMKQDSLTDKNVKTKYSNWNGGVGISYAFGG